MMLHTLQPAEADIGETFRLAMRHLASGVSVVTAGQGENRNGFTATSVISLSVEPSRLLVSVDTRSSAWPIIDQERAFSVAILAVEQRRIADDFAGRTDLKGHARFRSGQWQQHGTGWVLPGAIANIHCALEEKLERHDHMLLIGRVTASSAELAEPLIYWDRKYRGIETG
jgi:flavin reductase (DIM6/NTAB) family NADH-FMN oxidoreductase RutF